MYLYEDTDFFIQRQESEIPWLKIFTKDEYKELSDLPHELRLKLFELANIVEIQMRNYFSPDKINLASFANMLPRVHLHIMARYKNDTHFPEPMWGKKQRDAHLELPNFELFSQQLQEKLKDFNS